MRQNLSSVVEGRPELIDQKRIAEENAKLDAERRLKESEQARIASEHKATADLKAAQEKAKKESEAAIARERARVEAQRKAEEEAKAKREADERHRNKIRSEIQDDVENTAPHLLIKAIMDGAIRHVRVIW